MSTPDQLGEETTVQHESSFGHHDALEILQLVEADPTLRTLSLKIGPYEIELEREPVPTTEPAAPAEPEPPEPAAPAEPAALDGAGTDDEPVTTSIAGVFYRAPSPGEPPFVSVGDRVEAGQTVGIIEVMKLMNTVPTPVTGVVTAIPAENGQLVEFGAVVVRVRPDGADAAVTDG